MSLVRYHQRSFSALLPLFLAVAASIWPLHGQVLYGTLVCTVEDSSHAMIPRAASAARQISSWGAPRPPRFPNLPIPC